MNPEKAPVKEGGVSKKERLERKMSRIMEIRHNTAVAGLEVEKILSQTISADYLHKPTSADYEDLHKKALSQLKHLERGKSKAEKEKYTMFERAIDKYLLRKIDALRTEQEFNKKILESKKEITPESLGEHIFYLRTGRKPYGAIRAERREAYFILSSGNKSDYSAITEGELEEGPIKKDASGGRYHRAMKLSSDTDIKIMVVSGDINENTVLHERQHFINETAFEHFALVEEKNYSAPEFGFLNVSIQEGEADVINGLRYVKDEVLAYFRDGSYPEGVTDFIKNKKLYGHLYEFFTTEEMRDVKRLLEEIQKRLNDIDGLLYEISPDIRAIFVNHLIDIPLARFPKWLEVMAGYYKSKFKEFSDLMPPYIKSRVWSIEAMDLEHEMVDCINKAKEIILSENNAEEKLEPMRKDMIKMSDKYEQLRIELVG